MSFKLYEDARKSLFAAPLCPEIGLMVNFDWSLIGPFRKSRLPSGAAEPQHCVEITVTVGPDLALIVNHNDVLSDGNIGQVIAEN